MCEENINYEKQELVLNEKIKSDLLPTAKWAKYFFYYQCVSIFLSIILILTVLFSPEIISKLIPNLPTNSFGVFRFVFIACLLMATGISVFLASKARRFADSMKEACLTNSASEAQRGFAAMQSFSHFTGCLSLIGICLFAVPVFFLILFFVIGAIARLLT